jgi:hypothetical protein
MLHEKSHLFLKGLQKPIIRVDVIRDVPEILFGFKDFLRPDLVSCFSEIRFKVQKGTVLHEK